MEEAGVRKDTIEKRIREIQFEKILVPNFTMRILPRHLTKLAGSVQTNGRMTEILEGQQVPTRSTSEIQYSMAARPQSTEKAFMF